MKNGELNKAALIAIRAKIPFWEFALMAKRAYIQEGLEHYPNVCVFARNSGVHRNTLVRYGAHKKNWKWAKKVLD